MIYFEAGGWWLPDGEAHLQEWMLRVNKRVGPRLTYQNHKYAAALKWASGRGTAVDIGAHVGLWSWQMAGHFAEVVAFEPMTQHRACWAANMSEIGNARLMERCALGATEGEVRLLNRTPGSSGDTGVDPVAERSSLRATVLAEAEPGGETAPLRTLDSFALGTVDFIKIDCEGYELFVLQGAVETLRRSRPCIIVEQKPETGMEARYGVGTTDAVAFLEAMGATRRAAIQGDYILSWD